MKHCVVSHYLYSFTPIGMTLTGAERAEAPNVVPHTGLIVARIHVVPHTDLIEKSMTKYHGAWCNRKKYDEIPWSMVQ
jgi:hypothetical protein